MNKRQALIGWIVYSTAKPIVKRVVKRKAKAAVPGKREGSRFTPNTAAIVAGVGAAAGALLIWRKKSGGIESPAS